MKLRKKLHNELVDLKGNIRVYCRVRPLIGEDGGGKLGENVVSFDRNDDGIVMVQSKESSKKFEMDRVFSPGSSQEQVRRHKTDLRRLICRRNIFHVMYSFLCISYVMTSPNKR